MPKARDTKVTKDKATTTAVNVGIEIEPDPKGVDASS